MILRTSPRTRQTRFRVDRSRWTGLFQRKPSGLLSHPQGLAEVPPNRFRAGCVGDAEGFARGADGCAGAAHKQQPITNIHFQEPTASVLFVSPNREKEGALDGDHLLRPGATLWIEPLDCDAFEDVAVDVQTSERHALAVVFSRRVARRIRQIAPQPAVGRWPRCKTLVEEPTRPFRAALTRWEDTGSFEALQALRAAVVALLRAFTEAARQWREGGRPGRAEGRERVA